MKLDEAVAAQKPLVQSLLDGVAAIGADQPGITRDAYGRGENEAHDLGPVEIWDSQWGLFVIQALDGSLCID